LLSQNQKKNVNITATTRALVHSRTKKNRIQRHLCDAKKTLNTRTISHVTLSQYNIKSQ